MDLRAFLHILLFLCCVGIHKNAFSKGSEPTLPNEIKFAEITFQLNPTTQKQLQQEVVRLETDAQNLNWHLEHFTTYLSIVEPILQTQKIPLDFKFLTLFNHYQTEEKKLKTVEKGVLWVLSKEVAQEVQLIVNQQIDERKHLLAATTGASDCISKNQLVYKNWASSLFAHLADKTVLNTLGIKKKWGQSNRISLDNDNYGVLINFLAYKLVIEKNFPLYSKYAKQLVYEYPYSKGKSLEKIAQELKTETSSLKENNQWLLAKEVPEGRCNVLVVVPADKLVELKNQVEVVEGKIRPTTDVGFPILKRMQTLNKGKGGSFYMVNDLKAIQADMCDSHVTLAYKADITLKKFLELNDMLENDLVKIGQIYYLEEKKSTAQVPFHIVREGETLWDISQMYGLNLKNLMDFNRIETKQKLQRGRVMWLQEKRPKNKPIEYVKFPETKLEQITEEPSNTVEDAPIVHTNIEPKQPTPPIEQPIQKVDNQPIKSVEDVVVKEIEKPKTSRKSYKFLYHIVREGETIFNLSQKYLVEEQTLRTLNSLPSNELKVGDLLKIKPLTTK